MPKFALRHRREWPHRELLAETNNPNRLARRGWNRNVFEDRRRDYNRKAPGEERAPSLRLTQVVLADGTELDPL